MMLQEASGGFDMRLNNASRGIIMGFAMELCEASRGFTI